MRPGPAGCAKLLTIEIFLMAMVGGDMAAEPENQSIRPRHRRALKVLAKAPPGQDVNALLTRAGFASARIAFC
jgi:hypothetical protein